jgi:hypothetical protein
MDTTDCYWSIELCGWARSPRADDALATPWSGADLRATPLPHPLDADDLLRARRPGHVPGPRRAEAPVRR